jgi:hypothetical protein
VSYFRSVLASLARHAESINELQEILKALSTNRHPITIEVAKAYAAEVQMFGLLCYEFLGLFVKGNPPKRIPLEFLENVFLSAKKVALDAIATAEMLETKKSKAAKAARKISNQAILYAKATARALAGEMRTQDTWSKEIAEQIELEDWL